MSRKITIKALKYNPLSKISKPHFASYELEETSGMTLFVALTQIREKFDPDLSFDFVCRAGICGSCGMLVNGKPKLACRTLTKDYESGVIELMPLPVFSLIKDLSVNTGKWMANMDKRVESWIHTTKQTDISKLEEKVDPELAQKTFELDRCVECGLCVAACGTAIMRSDFLGAVGLNRIARFHQDPLDERTDEDFYELIGDDSGVFGCMSLLGCEDVCPKHLPLQNQIAFIRRKMASAK
ncbi:fumarate reductase, iron-sulfur subunit [Campylobacter ureolyticus RIGS 9880]|uniref:Fumarate reductase iron-sulfur subunit n=2 Tax=Campylobacter ureolyticus TaxID=827 RepID=A0A2I1NBI1_9BACT|nr:fumarate reductase iron-sulfur subunit [Campylobacter ureolyticus]AKT90829.1 fumarate reductase, iron-sulfur subunit [Campylobacter ureolyticus RIGS 9880]MCR8685501.1 fumarate reductase iron-sulfur subunit [Campylobacter ureolyticus]MCR8699955.1 fumarate reductase iron-sulfur subunit [Campylobacter ureolyticus]MCZ6106027.1 fumarate reductase iron-sulfur subunit [Campylobacter ureolyticus]MCZ6110821.1 fumarate reductase iron-sulfur subunit [Campylobacter ureolyticus]